MEGETVEGSLVREFEEEAGVKIHNPEKIGYLEFKGKIKDGGVIEVHVFKAHAFSGELVETEEMRPQWFHIDEIPFTDMWPDDAYWFPLFLQGKKFKGRFTFGENDIILEKELEEVENL